MTKSIFITGCSSGIGLAAATALQQRGYQVIASARKADDVKKLQALGLQAVQCDVNDSASIAQAVSQILELTGGQLDALFNNAGFGQTGAVEDISREVLRQQFETNVFGLQELTNKIIPIMRRQGHGRIINVSSLLGLVSMPYRGAYNASKFAVEALSDALRMELCGSNIHVSLIEPGPIISEFRNNAIEQHQQHINSEQSEHSATYKKMKAKTIATADKPHSGFRLTPDAVIKKLIHALENPRPKARYYVTKPTYLFAVLKRVLPTKGLDWVLQRVG